MISSMAYCFGFKTSGLSPVREACKTSFVTEDIDNDWTLVDFDRTEEDGNSDAENHEPPPPSPPVESSWIITPPPCFNAESHEPMVKHSPMENLLIEHPSIFLWRPIPVTNNLNKPEPRPAESIRSTSTNLRQKSEKPRTCALRSRRKMAASQKMAAINQQKRRTADGKFKRCNWEGVKRSGLNVRRMRKIIQQPRKHC